MTPARFGLLHDAVKVYVPDEKLPALPEPEVATEEIAPKLSAEDVEKAAQETGC